MTRSALVPALVATVALAALPARAQQPQTDPQHAHDHADAAAASAPEKAADMRDMHMQMMQMMSGMKANDAKLDDLLKTMNAATGSAKIEAMAALLNALVEERAAMQPMMHHMMSMMGMGMMSPAGGHEHEASPQK